jgi:hypothetical protein
LDINLSANKNTWRHNPENHNIHISLSIKLFWLSRELYRFDSKLQWVCSS